MADNKSGPTPEDIMKPSGMKLLLDNSKEKTIYAAIGLTKAKKGVVMISQTVNPKKLQTMLVDQAKKIGLDLDIPSLRCGTALVDKTVDKDLVVFTVNKDAPGDMDDKVRDFLKGAGYKQVQINADPGLEAGENAGQEAETQEGVSASTRPQPDATALTNLLGQLILQIPKVSGGTSAIEEPLVRLAEIAQSTLKSGNLVQAAADIEQLRVAMVTAQDAAKSAPATPENLAKTSKIWIAVRKNLQDDLDRLRSEIVATYQAEGIAAELEKRYRERVAPVLTALDNSLSETLEEASHAAEAPAMLARLRQAVIDNANVFEVLMDAVRCCSLGQITEALFEVGGQYRRNM